MAGIIEMQNSLKRRLGIAGFDHDEYRPNPIAFERSQIESAGRTNPVFPQSIIAQKAIMTMPPDENMDLGGEVMAPPAARPNAMKPMIGEWAVKRKWEAGHKRAAVSGGLFAELQVFTCANAIPKKYPIVFAGILTNPQDLMDANRDDAGGLDTQGTVSGINTGPDHFYAGDFAWIGEPYMIEIDGKMVMGVTWSGGEPDKAYFGVYRLRWTCVADALAQTKDVLNGYADSDLDLLLNTDDFGVVLRRDHGVHEEMPLFHYAMIQAKMIGCKIAQRAVLEDATGNAALVQEFAVRLNALFDYLGVVETEIEVARREYDESIGMVVEYKQTALQLADQLILQSGMVDEALLHARFTELSGHAFAYQEIQQSRMHDFLHARIMGKVLTDSTSGSQLDLNLGCALGR